MTGFAVSARDRRTLLTGLLSCATVLGAGRGIPYWHDWRDGARQRVLASTSALTHAEAVLASRSQIDRGKQEARVQRVWADSLTLEGATAAAGAAELARMVSDVADSARAKVMSLQVRADTSLHSTTSRASVRLIALGDITGLTAMLEDLESGAPLLVVRELSVSQGEPIGADERPEQLRVEIVVEGLTRPAHADSGRVAMRRTP